MVRLYRYTFIHDSTEW